MQRLFRYAVLLVLTFLPAALRADDAPTVGYPARIRGLVLPGPELEPKPLDDRKAPVVVRVENVYPHGTAFRYDLVYYGLEPGKFDLKDYLRRKDGSATADLPAIPVEVRSVLPAGQVEPNALKAERPPFLGGYLVTLIVAGVLWVIGLFVILLAGRRRRRARELLAVRPLTAAERLRPLVEGAMAGRLTASQRADLERTLLAYWGRRLGLRDRKPAEAIRTLKAHPEAGPLLTQLEAWLHRPGSGRDVNVTTLLGPYQNVPAEALEAEAKA